VVSGQEKADALEEEPEIIDFTEEDGSRVIEVAPEEKEEEKIEEVVTSIEGIPIPPDDYKSPSLSELIQHRLRDYCASILEDADMKCIPVREHDYIEYKDIHVIRTPKELFPVKEEFVPVKEDEAPPEKERVRLDISRDIVLEKISRIEPEVSAREFSDRETGREDDHTRDNLEGYLFAAIEKKASNLHLILDFPPAIRLYGELQKLDFPPVSREFMNNLVNAILDEKQLSRFLYDKNIDMFYQFYRDEQIYSFKVNIYEHLGGWNANFYFVPNEIPAIEDLHLPDIINSFAFLKSGLVIFAGPSRCGKTTTLNSLLKYINTNRSARIVTVENPIEYVHISDWSLVSQRQIGLHSETLKSAVDFAVRENPDIIVIGEISEPDIMYSAMRVAETGKLVFTTMTASSASTVIRTILDYFPEKKKNQIKEMLSEVIRGICTQHLLQGMNKKCMIPAVEVLLGCKKLMETIKKENLEELAQLMKNSSRSGMRSLDYSLNELYENNVISHETALSLAQDFKTFTR